VHGSGFALAVVLGVLSSCSARSSSPRGQPPAAPTASSSHALLAPAAFAPIADRGLRSQAMFGEIARVLTHPRCVNCHPADDSPRQGEQHALHDPPVLRGPADRGVPGLGCATCHQERNAELARVPGAPDWHLAPRAMTWMGKSPSEICAQIKDPARNGGRSLAQLHEHVAHDHLVAWGWQPGAGREAAPGSQAELAALVQAWIDTGAQCPAAEPAVAKPQKEQAR